MENVPQIINPEIPDSPDAKRELLVKCLAAIASGGHIEGVTAKHITSEGAVFLAKALRGNKGSGL